MKTLLISYKTQIFEDLVLEQAILIFLNFSLSFSGALFLVVLLKLTSLVVPDPQNFMRYVGQLDSYGELISIFTRFIIGFLSEWVDVKFLLLLPAFFRLMASIGSLQLTSLSLFALFSIKFLEKSSSTMWAVLREKLNLAYFSKDLTQLNYSRSSGALLSGFLYYFLEHNFHADRALKITLIILIFSCIFSIFFIVILCIFFPAKKKDEKNFVFFCVLLSALSLLRIPDALLTAIWNKNMSFGSYDILFYNISKQKIKIRTNYKKHFPNISSRLNNKLHISYIRIRIC